MNILQYFCQLKMHKLRHLATTITVLLFITHGVCPVSTFVLPSEADDTSKESTQIDTTSENLQPTQSIATSLKPGIGESAWLRELQNLEQQSVEASRANESKDSQNLKSATGENVTPARSSQSSSKSKGEKPSRRGKKNDNPVGRSSMLRNSEILTRETSKQMTPSIGYMSLEERIAAWLLANKKDNLWSGQPDDEESNPRHDVDDASLLLHVDKVQNYGNSRSSYAYDEDQPHVRGFGISGSNLDDTLHAYHFNNDFMNNGLFPSFEGQEGYKNYMDIGKSHRPKGGLGKDRSSSTSLYDKLEAKRNSNNDAAKLHFAYYYDPESHYGSPEMKPTYPFFDKQYNMDDVFPFDGMGTKEKKPQHPKNTRKSQPKEHENNSFFTLENYVEDSAATRNEASSNKESKNVKAKAPQENKNKPPAAKQSGTNKKSNSPTNNAQNAKKTKAKVDNKDSRALNSSRKASSNNVTKTEIDIVSSISNSSLNVSTNVNMSANSKVSAVRNQDNHTELEEVLKGDVLNRSDTVESENGTPKTVSSSIQTANITSFQDTTTENKTSLTSASANRHIPESTIKNENNSYLHNETTESPSNNSIEGESITFSNLTLQLDSRHREAKLETALSQSNETKLENIATNFTDSENAIVSKPNTTKDQMTTSVFNQTTLMSEQTTPTYSEPTSLTTTEPNLISQKNGTGGMSFNHKEPHSVAAAKNATLTDVLEITSDSTSENVSTRSDRLVNESTSYSHRNSSSLKTSQVQEEKRLTLNETWNLEVVNATDLRASVLASTGTNELIVDELLTVFSTSREQKNSDVKPLSTTETPMKHDANVTFGDMPNNSSTSTDSVSSKNVERRSKNDDMDYEKVFVSSSSSKEVLVSKQNGTERGDLSSGNRTHIASLLEVVGGDTKIEELAPKGTEREEKSEPTEEVKAHIDQSQNKTDPEILRNSEEVMSRLEILNVTADTVHKVNESSVTSTVSANKTTTESSLSIDQPNFETNRNSTLIVKTAFNSSALIKNLAVRTADQKSIEPFQATGPNQIVNSTQSNQTNANLTLNIIATAENSTISFANTTKDADISTNTTSSLEIAHTNVSSSNGDIISNLAPSNSLNVNGPAASAQHKNLTSKLSLDANVSKTLLSLDKDVLINGTEQSIDRATTEGLTQVNSSLTLNKTDTLNRILSGERLESLSLDMNSTAESKLPTSMENQTASNIANTSTDNSWATTTASDIMFLPEALPNSEVHVGKQLDNHKPQLDNVGNALQPFSNSLNDSMPTNSNQTAQDRGQNLTVDNVNASNSTLDSTVSFNGTDANNKLLNNEGKVDSFRAAHSCNESSSGNKGIISAAASADVKAASPSTNSTNEVVRTNNNRSMVNDTQNVDNETSVLGVGGLASQDVPDVNRTIASVQRRSADKDPKVVAVGGDTKPSAVNNTRNSSAEAESFSNPEKLQHFVASSEDDIPPISAYMVQDFSLRKTPETKNTKDNSSSNKPKESTTQGSSDKAKVDGKQGAAVNASASPLSNITSRAAEAQCLGPACDLAPMSAVSRSQAAVSAVLTTHFGPAKDIMIPFDLELLDLADNYDNTTGMFICTVPGTYVISLYLMSHPGAKVNARIFVNNRPIAALWADDSKNAGFYPSSSTQTIAQLGFGDQVYVMLVDGGYGESWVHANYNVFTIFLLYEQVF